MNREGTSKLGWCLTGHHDECPGTTVSGLECSCEHHNREETDDGQRRTA